MRNITRLNNQSRPHRSTHLGLVSPESLCGGDLPALQLFNQLTERHFDDQLTLHGHQLTADSELFGEQLPAMALQVQPAPYTFIVLRLQVGMVINVTQS